MIQINSKLRLVPALILASSLAIGCADRGFKTTPATGGPAKTTAAEQEVVEQEDLAQDQEEVLDSLDLEKAVSQLLENPDFLEQSEIIADTNSLIEAVVLTEFEETAVWNDMTFQIQLAVVSKTDEGRQFDFVNFGISLNSFSEHEYISDAKLIHLANGFPLIITLEADKTMMDINFSVSDPNWKVLYSVKYETQAAGLVMVKVENNSDVTIETQELDTSEIVENNSAEGSSNQSDVVEDNSAESSDTSEDSNSESDNNSESNENSEVNDESSEVSDEMEEVR